MGENEFKVTAAQVDTVADFIERGVIPQFEAAVGNDPDADHMLGVSQVTVRALRWLLGTPDEFLDRCYEVAASAESEG